MAKVHYLDPIDYLSGKITKRHRTIYCYRYAIDRRYTTVHTTPTGAPTAAQLASNAKFRQAAQQTNTIMTDVSQVQTYSTQWRAHMQTAHPRYRTLRGFIFSKVYLTL
jgi:hypothetical protein